ncbi:hypothetical protein ACOMHN_064793 [Nucella lapillus]
MADSVAVRRQPEVHGRFLTLDHSYWKDRLPRGFKFYLDRLARGFVRVQPSNGAAFAMVLMEEFLKKRNDELEKLPEVSYLNRLREKVEKRVCRCGQGMPLSTDEPREGEFVVCKCVRCGHTVRELQTPELETEPVSFNGTPQQEDALSMVSEDVQQKRPVTTITREVHTKGLACDEGVQVNFGQEQATQMFSPPPPVRRPQPVVPKPKVSPTRDPENICTTCLVDAVEDHARAELMNEDPFLPSPAGCCADPVMDTRCTEAYLGNEMETQVSGDFCRRAQQEQYSQKPGRATVGECAKCSQVNGNFCPYAQQEQYSPKPGQTTTVGECSKCGEKVSYVASPSTQGKSSVNRYPNPDQYPILSPMPKAGFCSVSGVKNTGAVNAGATPQGQSGYCPLCQSSPEPSLASPPSQGHAGFKPVPGPVPVYSPQPGMESEYSRLRRTSCMADEVEAQAVGEMLFELPGIDRCLAFEIHVESPPPLGRIQPPPPPPGRSIFDPAVVTLEKGFRPISNAATPQPINTPHAQYTQRANQNQAVCDSCVQMNTQRAQYTPRANENQAVCGNCIPMNTQRAQCTQRANENQAVCGSCVPMNTQRAQYTQRANENQAVCGSCVASAVEDRAFDELRSENTVQITCRCAAKNKQTTSSSPPTKPSYCPVCTPSLQPRENQSPRSSQGSSRPAPAASGMPAAASIGVCSDCVASEAEDKAIAELFSENPICKKCIVCRSEITPKTPVPVQPLQSLSPGRNQGFRPVSEPSADKKRARPKSEPPISPLHLRPSPEPYAILSPIPVTPTRRRSMSRGPSCVTCGRCSSSAPVSPTRIDAGRKSKSPGLRCVTCGHCCATPASPVGHAARSASGDRDSAPKRAVQREPPAKVQKSVVSRGVQSSEPPVPPTNHPYSALPAVPSCCGSPMRENVGYRQSPMRENVAYSQSPMRENVGYRQSPMRENIGYSQSPMRENVVYSQSPMRENVAYSQSPMRENVRYSQSPMRENVYSQSPMRENVYSQSPMYQMYAPMPPLPPMMPPPPCCPMCCRGQSPLVAAQRCCGMAMQYPFCFMPPPPPHHPDLQAYGPPHASHTQPPSTAPSSPQRSQQYQSAPQSPQPPDSLPRSPASPNQCVVCSSREGKDRAVDRLAEYCILGALSSDYPEQTILPPLAQPRPVPTPSPQAECGCQRLMPIRAESPSTYTAVSDLPDNTSRMSSPPAGLSHHGQPPISVNVNVEVDSNFDSQRFMQEVKQQISQAMDQVMQCQMQAVELQRQCLQSDQAVLRDLEQATRPMITAGPAPPSPQQATSPTAIRTRETSPTREAASPVDRQQQRQPSSPSDPAYVEQVRGPHGGQQRQQKRRRSLEGATLPVTKHSCPAPLPLQTVDSDYHTFSTIRLPHNGKRKSRLTKRRISDRGGIEDGEHAADHLQKEWTDPVKAFDQKTAQDGRSNSSRRAVSAARGVKWTKSDPSQLRSLGSHRNDSEAQVLKCRVQKKHRHCVKRTVGYIDEDIFPDTVLSARQDWIWDWILGYFVRRQCRGLMAKSKYRRRYKVQHECHLCFVTKRSENLQKAMVNHFPKVQVDKKTPAICSAVETGPNYRDKSRPLSDKVGHVENDETSPMTYWEPQGTVAFIEDILLEIVQRTLDITDTVCMVDIEDRSSDADSQENGSPCLPRYFPERKTRDTRVPSKDHGTAHGEKRSERVLERRGRSERKKGIPQVKATSALAYSEITAQREHRFRKGTGVCGVKCAADGRPAECAGDTGGQSSVLLSPLTGPYGQSSVLPSSLTGHYGQSSMLPSSLTGHYGQSSVLLPSSLTGHYGQSSVLPSSLTGHYGQSSVLPSSLTGHYGQSSVLPSFLTGHYGQSSVLPSSLTGHYGQSSVLPSSLTGHYGQSSMLPSSLTGHYGQSFMLLPSSLTGHYGQSSVLPSSLTGHYGQRSVLLPSSLTGHYGQSSVLPSSLTGHYGQSSVLLPSSLTGHYGESSVLLPSSLTGHYGQSSVLLPSSLTGHYGQSSSHVRARAPDLAFLTRSARRSRVCEARNILNVLDSAVDFPKPFLVKTVSPKLRGSSVPLYNEASFSSAVTGGSESQFAKKVSADVVVKTATSVNQRSEMELEKQSCDFATERPLSREPYDRVWKDPFMPYSQSSGDSSMTAEETTVNKNSTTVSTKQGELYVPEVYPTMNDFNKALIFYTALLKSYPSTHLLDAQCISVMRLKAFRLELKKEMAVRNTGVSSPFLDSSVEEHIPPQWTDSFLNRKKTCFWEEEASYGCGREHVLMPWVQTDFYPSMEGGESNTNTSARSNSPASLEDDEQDKKPPSLFLTSAGVEMQGRASDLDEWCTSHQTASSQGPKAQATGGFHYSSDSPRSGLQGVFSCQHSENVSDDHDESLEKEPLGNCRQGRSSLSPFCGRGRCVKPQHVACSQEGSSQLHHSKDGGSAEQRRPAGRAPTRRKTCFQGAPGEKTQTLPYFPCYSLTPARVQCVRAWLEDDDDDDDDIDEEDLSCMSSSTVTQMQLSPHLSPEPGLARGSDVDLVFSSSDTLCPGRELARRRQELSELDDFVALEKACQEDVLQQTHPKECRRRDLGVDERGQEEHSEQALWEKERQQNQVVKSRKLERAAEVRTHREHSELEDFEALENGVKSEDHVKEQGGQPQNPDHVQRLSVSDQLLRTLDSIPEEDEEVEVQELSKRLTFSDIDLLVARVIQCKTDNNIWETLCQLKESIGTCRGEREVTSYEGAGRTGGSAGPQDRGVEVCTSADSLEGEGHPPLATRDRSCALHNTGELHSHNTAAVDHSTVGASSHSQGLIAHSTVPWPDGDVVERLRQRPPNLSTVHSRRQQKQSGINCDCSSSPVNPKKMTHSLVNAKDMTSSGESLMDSGFESGDKSWMPAENSVAVYSSVDTGSSEGCDLSRTSTYKESPCTSDPAHYQPKTGNKSIKDEDKMFLSCEKEAESQRAKHISLVHRRQGNREAATNETESSAVSQPRPQGILRWNQTGATATQDSRHVPAAGSRRPSSLPVYSRDTSAAQRALKSKDKGGWRPAKKDMAASRPAASTVTGLAHRRWNKCPISDESVAAGYVVKKKMPLIRAEDTAKIRMKETEEKKSVEEVTNGGRLSDDGGLSDNAVPRSQTMRLDTTSSKLNSSVNRPASVSYSSEIPVEEDTSNESTMNQRKSMKLDLNTEQSKSETRKAVEKDSDSITTESLKCVIQNPNVEEPELYSEAKQPCNRRLLVRKSESKQSDQFFSHEKSTFKNIDTNRSESLLERRKLAVMKWAPDLPAKIKSQPVVFGSRERVIEGKGMVYLGLSQKDGPTRCRSHLSEGCLRATRTSSEASKATRTYSEKEAKSLLTRDPSRNTETSSMDSASFHSLSSDVSVDDEHFWSNCKVISFPDAESDWTASHPEQHDAQGQPEVQTSNPKLENTGDCYQEGKHVSEKSTQPACTESSSQSISDETVYVRRFYRELLAVVNDELEAHGCAATSATSVSSQAPKTYLGGLRKARNAFRRMAGKQELNRSTDTSDTGRQEETANVRRHDSGQLEPHAPSPSQVARKVRDSKLGQGTSDQAISTDSYSSTHSTLTGPSHGKAVVVGHAEEAQNPWLGNLWHRAAQPSLGKRKKESAERGPVGLLGKFFASFKPDAALRKTNSLVQRRDV